MPEVFLSRDELLALLPEAPARLAAATVDVDPVVLRTRPAPDEWSPVEILAHMRACDDIWGGCARRILAEDHPTIQALGPRTWVHQTDYATLDFDVSLRAFAAQRADLIDVLTAAGPDEWLRSATVLGAGGRLERNVYWYAHGIPTHERSHVKVIEQIARRTA
jgi:hypothetical protein